MLYTVRLKFEVLVICLKGVCFEARKVLETLVSENCKEAFVLKTRMAQIEAAFTLNGSDLANLQKLTLKQCLGVLRGEMASLPLSLRLTLVSRGFCCKFESLQKLQPEMKPQDFSDQMDKLFSGIGFWLPQCVLEMTEDDPTAGVDFDQPSLVSLVAEATSLDEGVGFDDLVEDDVIKEKELASKARWEAGLLQEVSKCSSAHFDFSK